MLLSLCCGVSRVLAVLAPSLLGLASLVTSLLETTEGGFMRVFQAGLLVPVAVGPIIGGGISGSLGWRAIFWFLTIYSGVFLVSLLVLLPDTAVASGEWECETI